MVNLMNLGILLTWIDFDGSVESGGSGGPFKLGILMILVNLVISVDMVADIIFVNFLHKHIFKNLNIYPKKVCKL